MGRVVDDQVAEYMRSIKIDIEELKNTQFIGADSLLVYTHKSANAYDYSTTVGAGSTLNMYYLFNAYNQDFPFYETALTVYKDDPSTLDTDPQYAIRSNELFNVPHELRMKVDFFNPDVVPHTYYFKFYLRASDRGIFTVNI